MGRGGAKKLVDARLKVNREKYEFCCSRVNYLGFLLDQDGLRLDPHRVAALLNYLTPTKRTVIARKLFRSFEKFS